MASPSEMAPKHMFSFVSQEARDRLTVHVLQPDGSGARSRWATNSDCVAEQAWEKAPPTGKLFLRDTQQGNSPSFSRVSALED